MTNGWIAQKVERCIKPIIKLFNIRWMVLNPVKVR